MPQIMARYATALTILQTSQDKRVDGGSSIDVLAEQTWDVNESAYGL